MRVGKSENMEVLIVTAHSQIDASQIASNQQRWQRVYSVTHVDKLYFVLNDMLVMGIELWGLHKQCNATVFSNAQVSFKREGWFASFD